MGARGYPQQSYFIKTAYSSYGIKVLISLGGWNDSAGTKYSTLVNSPSARANFVTNALAFVNQYGFGGIDLDWEYPVCPQNSCTGPASDKDGFTAWVQELAEAFHPEGLLVTAAVSGGHTIIDTSYDIPSLSTYLDHINVMTYDYHGYFDGQTGHVSPLYVHSGDVDTLFNTDSSITQWIDKGADPLKVIMGFPLYGQSFTLCDAASNGLNAASCGAGTAGTYTRQAGFLAYYEICFDLQQGGWTVVQDSEGAMGPYAYSGNQWVSYDDVAMVNTKAQYVLSRGLGGAMVWALDLDDFTNRCGTEAYPLLKTINRALRGYAK
ncbi:putative chitinase 3 [Armadillidium vulgare]|nr:putative chitinase 3 [Armadillidium vulgare]